MKLQNPTSSSASPRIDAEGCVRKAANVELPNQTSILDQSRPRLRKTTIDTVDLQGVSGKCLHRQKVKWQGKSVGKDVERWDYDSEG